MPRSSLAHRIAVPLALAALLAAPPAWPVTLNWNNAAGGSADTPGNWSPAQSPTLADLLTFNIASPYTVTFGSPLDSVQSHLFYSGSVTFDCPAPHYGRSLFIVAPASGNTATLVLTNGSYRTGYDARIGDVAGATGTVLVQGASAVLTQAAGGTFKVGNAGTGALQVSSGGTATTTGDLLVGATAGGVGTLQISGEVTVPSYKRSQAFVGQPGAVGVTTHVGYLGGKGTLKVENGAEFVNHGPLVMGQYASDTGTVRVGGLMGVDSSRATIDGDFVLAYGIGLNQPGGGATAIVDSNGVVIVGQTTRLGSPGGSNAVLRVRDKGRFMTRSLYWEKAGGDLDLPGGLVQVYRGSFTTSDNHFKLNSLGAKPTFELESGATASFSGSSATDTALIVGAKGSGRLRLTGGSIVNVSGGPSLLGQETGSLGELVLKGASSFLASGQRLVVGRNGRGELHVLEGSFVQVSGLKTGLAAGSGIVEVRDAGSHIDDANASFDLPSSSGAGGTGDVTIGSGGALNLTGSTPNTFVTSGGTLHVETGGTFDARYLAYVRGTGLVDLAGGTVKAQQFHVGSGGTLSGFGTLDGGLVPDGTDTTGAIRATGRLTMGNFAGSGGFQNVNTLDVGADTVTILSGTQARLGRVSIAGGRLVLPAAGGRIELGREIAGTGVIDGPLQNDGQLRSTAISALKFTGPVTGVGHAMLGERFEFLPGSSFTGSGSIAAVFWLDSLATLTATGPLTIGTGATNSPALAGTIVTGANRVEFVSPFSVTIGGAVTMANGRLAYSGAATTFTLLTAGHMTGRGSVEGNLFARGTLAPGTGGAGRLRVQGDLTLPGTYTCEMGVTSASEFDSLVCTGTLALSGTLDLRKLASFTATAGESIRIAQGATVTGTFANVTLGGASAAGQVAVHYTPTAVYVVFLPGVLGVDDGPRVSNRPATLRFSAVGSPGPSAALELALPEAAELEVHIFDVTGRELAELASGTRGAGTYRFALPHGTLPPGVCFARAIVATHERRDVRTVRLVSIR